MIKRIRAVFAALSAAATIVAAAPALAVPAICVMPTSGTVSGLTLVQDINNCYGAALGLFAGGTAPSSQTTGMLWWNTSSGYVAQWDGAAWNNLWNVDATNHLNAVQIGGGVPATLASASITDLWSVPASSVSVTGTTAITQLANADAVPGTIKIVTFAGALTLTQGTGAGGTPLNLPNNGSNIVTAAGDYAIVLALTATNVQIIHYERATGAALSTVGLSVGASGLAQSSQGYGSPLNLQLAAAVSGNNLTVSVLGVNGSNPSSPTNPVLVNFRSQTLNNGSNGIVYGQITSALSFQVTSGNTMGCTTAALCRLWVELICQTEATGACTSILLGLSNQSTAAQIYPLAEDALQSTGSGTSGGGSAGVIQTSVGGLSGKAIRIAGYIEVTWTSGTGWATTPSKVQVFGPGVHKPGDLVQDVFANSLTQAIAPTSAVNLVRMTFVINCQPNSASAVTQWTYKRGSTTLVTHNMNGGATALNLTDSVVLLDAPQIASSITYSANLISGSCGSGISTVDLQEIMGALDLEKMLPGTDDGAVDLPPRALAARQPDRARQKAA
jgi:hypothetical protein